jgi:hypothetical protein
VSTAQDAWIARCAAAMCAASRWLFAPSLALSLVALAWGGLAGWAVVAALGIVQAYLAARIEFDRAIFEALAARPEEAGHFDAAAGIAPGRSGRPMAERASGARRLIVLGASIFIMQMVLAAALRWPR